MMTNKVLVNLYIPKIEKKYNVWLPINKKISNIIRLLTKAVKDMNDNYKLDEILRLYDKDTAKPYKLNQTVKEAGIRNGTEIILI